MILDYYLKNEAEQFDYIKIPMALVKEEIFAQLSSQAKILYGLLLDKMGESMKKSWVDSDNYVFVIYPVEEIQHDMGMSRRKVIDSLTELNDIGLICKRRQGRGNPNLIYVKNYASIQV